MKLYICTECKNSYRFKFKDSTKCLFCQDEAHEKIRTKLEKYNLDNTKKNKRYHENYLNKKHK